MLERSVSERDNSAVLANPLFIQEGIVRPEGAGARNHLPTGRALPDFMGSSASGGASVRPGRGVGDWMRCFAGAGIELGARANDITAGASETGGSLASTMGSMIANAAGIGLGPRETFRIGSFRKSELNRSSKRARNYFKLIRDRNESGNKRRPCGIP